MMKMHWTGAFVIASLAFVASGCDRGNSSKNQPRVDEKLQVTDSISHRDPFRNNEVNILRVGESSFYIPISWLYYNRLISNKSEAAGAIHISPPFVGHNDQSTIHTLDPASKGIIFRIRNRGNLPRPGGIDPNSSVSAIAFQYVPKSKNMDKMTFDYQKHSFNKVIHAKSDDRWVKFENRYYDISDKDAGFIMHLPMVESGAALHVGSGSYKYNDDVMIFYTWTPQSGEIPSPEWRRIRHSIDQMIRWLALPPDQRAENPNFVVGDLLRSQGSEK